MLRDPVDVLFGCGCAGEVNGAPLVVTSGTGTAGLARLVYDEARSRAAQQPSAEALAAYAQD